MNPKSDLPFNVESQPDVRLSIASWEPRSIVNGPGERFVLWLQGCPFRCPSCFNQEFLPFTRNRTLGIRQLAERVLSIDGIEGITYSGGEPMAQPHGLSLLTDLLRSNGLTVVCYTGYTLAELEERNDPWTTRLLQQIDILIDGRFELEQQSLLPWRGSRNQVVHFLTKRYQDFAIRLKTQSAEAEVELIIKSDGYTATGIINHELLAEMDSILQKGMR